MISAQAVRFLIVGVSNTAISYTMFFFCFSFLTGGSLIISQLLSYSSGVMWSYYWNNRWTFHCIVNNKYMMMKFISLQIFLLLLSTTLMHISSMFIQYSLSLIWLMVMVFITLLNFLFSKYLVFKK